MSIVGLALEGKFRASTSSMDVKMSSSTDVDRLQTLLYMYRPHFALTIINELHLLCLHAVGTACYPLTSDRSAGVSMNIAYWQYFGTVPTNHYIASDCLTKVSAR